MEYAGNEQLKSMIKCFFIIWEIFTVYFSEYVKVQHMHDSLNLKHTHIYHVIYYIT